MQALKLLARGVRMEDQTTLCMLWNVGREIAELKYNLYGLIHNQTKDCYIKHRGFWLQVSTASIDGMIQAQGSDCISQARYHDSEQLMLLILA